MIGEDRDGEEGGVVGSGASDGEGADGDAPGHLNDGVERIDALHGVRFDGDAEDGYEGMSGDHAGEMGRAASTGDDNFDSALFGLAGVGCHVVWRAVGADDAAFMRDAEEVEHVVGVTHGFPVGL